MVCTNYCAPYPKRPYIVHEINMWYPYCMMSLVLDLSTLFSVPHDSTEERTRPWITT